MTKIRIGALACSSIARRNVFPVLHDSDAFELTFVASRTEETRKAAAEQYGCSHGTYEELLGRADVDAVYVSTVPSLHYRWAERVLAAGKHLLLEKPFTDSYDTAEALVRLGAARGLVAMEALVYVFHPLYGTVRKLIADGAIGTTRRIEAVFGFPFMPDGDYRNRAELGGGATLDALVYPLSLAVNVAGRAPERYWSTVNASPQHGVDADGALLLDFGAGLTAHVNYGFGMAYRSGYTVWGSDGYLSVDRGFTRPADLPGEIVVSKNQSKTIVSVPPNNHFAGMLDAFAGKIRGRDRDGVNEGSDVLTRMRIISDVYAGAQCTSN